MADNNKVAGINRALAGELHDILEKKTGLQTRGLYDPRPLLIIKRLRGVAERRGCKLALEILAEAEQDLFVRQYADLTEILSEDISVLGLTAGNQENRTRSLEEVIG